MRKLAQRVTSFIDEHIITLVEVMHMALSRDMLPHQAQARPMWMYTGEGDSIWSIGDKFYGNKSMREMFSLLFKKQKDGLTDNAEERGYCMEDPQVRHALVVPILFQRFD